MFRRLFFVAVAAAVALSACSSTPAAPPLTDPKEILTKSVDTIKDVKTLHFRVEASGKLALGSLISSALPSGASGTGGVVDIAGTTAEGDVDLIKGNCSLHAEVPAFLGATADLILIGNTGYLKSSFLGPKFSKSEIPAGQVSCAGTAVPTIAEELKTYLNTPGVAPTKLADEKCGDKDCYHVQLTLTSEQLSDVTGSLASGAPAPTGTIDVWVQKNDLRPAKFTVAGSAGDQGNLTVTMTLTNYDAAVTVNPPAASEIEGAASPAPTSS